MKCTHGWHGWRGWRCPSCGVLFDSTLCAVDTLSRQLLEARSFQIAERSGDMTRDWRALLDEVNSTRLSVGLDELPPLDHWNLAEEDV